MSFCRAAPHGVTPPCGRQGAPPPRDRRGKRSSGGGSGAGAGGPRGPGSRVSGQRRPCRAPDPSPGARGPCLGAACPPRPLPVPPPRLPGARVPAVRGCPVSPGLLRGGAVPPRALPGPAPPALGWGLLPRVTRGRPLLPAGFPGRGAAGAAVAALPALPAPAAAGQRFAFVPPPRCGIPGGGPPGDFPGADSPATPLGDQLGLWGGGSPAAPRFHHGRDRPQLDRASGPRSWLPAASPGREGGPGRAGGSPGAGGDPSCPRAPSSRLLASFSPALSRSSCRQDKPLRPGAGSSNRCVWELLLGGTRCPPGFSPSALPGVTLAGRARGPEPAASGAATVGPCAKPCFY